eukprot:2616418-Pyramimonas_sp.AAC.1
MVGGCRDARGLRSGGHPGGRARGLGSVVCSGRAAQCCYLLPLGNVVISRRVSSGRVARNCASGFLRMEARIALAWKLVGVAGACVVHGALGVASSVGEIGAGSVGAHSDC